MLLEKPARITSIDLLRGLIMVVMALDHSRFFLHTDEMTHDPLDLSYTTFILFFTRWITHYCAPNFIFIAGISAFLYGQKKGNNLTRFLVTRGLWLILLELTLFKYLWTGHLFTNMFPILVIWAIGISMVFLAFWHKLPFGVILISGLAMIFLHNLTDSYNPDPTTAMGIVWTFLHKPQGVAIGNVHLFVLYSVLPYFGLISVGYCFGRLYLPNVEPEKRQRTLILSGIACIVLFVVLRMFNLYGDPKPWVSFDYLWSTWANYRFTFMSFVNTNKYPCSLLFILMTVGPALIFLGLTEKFTNSFANFFITIGKVPMFFYILHLCLLRGIGLLLGYFHPNPNLNSIAVNTPQSSFNQYHLTTVYFAWLFVVPLLYFACSWYSKYKAANPEKWWLSYL